MKHLWVVLFLFTWGVSQESLQDSLQAPREEVSYPKLLTFTGATLVGTGVIFYSFLRVAWWDKEQSKFFFKDDLSYVLNIDKVAHFYGGYGIASVTADGLLWSGVPGHVAYGSAWAYSTAIQVMIDYKDGLTPGFGFSKWDVIAGSAGAALPWIEYAVWGENQQSVDLKFSYYRNSTAYEEAYGVQSGLDDYTNQTYYITYYPGVNSHNYWNRLWGISMGLSINEDPWSVGPGRGQWEVLLGLDYNLEALVKSENMNPFWRGFWRYLNHVKLPAPMVMVYPHWEMHWAYPIRF